MQKSYKLLYTFIFMGIGVLTTLIGQYMDHIGFSGRQIGLITAAGTFTAIFASPFWGRRYSVLSVRERAASGWSARREHACPKVEHEPEHGCMVMGCPPGQDGQAARGASAQGKRHLLVFGVSLCAAAAALALSAARSFSLFIILFVILYFFQAPMSSLSDALTIDDDMKYGSIRTFGAIGFAAASLIAASAADHAGIEVIFPIYSCCFAAVALIVLYLRKIHIRGCRTNNDDAHDPDIRDVQGESRLAPKAVLKGDCNAPKAVLNGSCSEPKAVLNGSCSASKDGPKGDCSGRKGIINGKCAGRNGREDDSLTEEYSGDSDVSLKKTISSLKSNRQYVIILICAFFINGTDVANNTYFSFLYLEGGGTLAGVGLAFFLMAGSEAPFMAASDWLSERFGQGMILLVAMIFSIVRFALFAAGLPYYVLLILFPLQGLVNGITIVEFVKFVAKVVPDALRGIGIAVYYALGSSFSTIVCQLAGGRLLDHGSMFLTGPESVYAFFALFNVLGVVLFWLTGMHKIR